MTKEISMSEIASEIYQSILATQKRQRKLLSKTLWARFGVQRRTPDLIDAVKETLRRQGIRSNLNDEEFGKEDKSDWIILMCDSPVELSMVSNLSSVLLPSQDWFTKLKSSKYESEREVEYYFIIPLLESLGYEESDIHIGYPVTMFEGVSPVKKEADVVLFKGESRSKEDILLVVEAKAMSKSLLLGAADAQAKSYSRELAAPYYLVTNAVETHLWRNRGGISADELLISVKTAELEEKWASLYQYINKVAVVEYKSKLKEFLVKNNM